MSYPGGGQEESPLQNMTRRVIALVILMAFLVITALMIAMGFTVNTLFDSILPTNLLPAPALAAFNTGVNYQLTTYSFLVIVIIIIAIAGSAAAIFGVAHQAPQETGW